MAPGILSMDLSAGRYTLEFSKRIQKNQVANGFSEGERTIPKLYGLANTGEHITLIDCFLLKQRKYNDEIVSCTFYVETVLVGYHFTSQKLEFNCFEFDMPEIVAWSDLCNFSLSIKSRSEQPLRFSYDWIEKEHAIFQIGNNLVVSFIPFSKKLSLSVSDSEYSLTQSIIVRFSYSTPVTLEKLWTDFREFLLIINLGIQSNLNRNQVVCYSCNICKMDSRGLITAYSARPQTISAKTTFLDYLFSLSELIEDDLVLCNWLEKKDDLNPIMNLYFASVMNPNLPLDVLFLNLVQALEIYHTRFRSQDKDRYKKRIERLLNACPKSQRQFHEKYLMPKSSKDEGITLLNRLSDLFICDFDIEFEKLDNKVFPYSFVDDIVNTRNYLTHYNKKKQASALSYSDILYSLLCLQTVLEYYILRELGFPQKVLSKALKKRNTEIGRQIRN